MPRVKRGVIKKKSKKKLLSQTKGYTFGRKSKKGLATEAYLHAGKYARQHRHKKKRDFRTLWNIKINASARQDGFSYSEFMNSLKKREIALDRKVLAHLAENMPTTFSRIIAQSK
ncbi:MAG: 50S ribosomal protein L20 [Candidatus Vogelbacteria bacterium CG10_big_fil_rev_8_21_14_0_10_45_14]|uniref:Large ribosomal subunit protein bL20 n=1 Tax=Candidatus Vogelbacteria bacterium CG10_big_fil_rev_8_21_14_0_10_45_14 TaxID=1975042 RepID=A0A2H0RKP3_9BACT|nr:MAG: 50S ribosomal protein L20 [Candidatus Vogelbacteria bacterium CG10_big_fil_rev_8_21_14_0_10_45_14]